MSVFHGALEAFSVQLSIVPCSGYDTSDMMHLCHILKTIISVTIKVLYVGRWWGLVEGVG